MSEQRFKVGDVVVGNASANGVYSVTKQGWIGNVEKHRYDGSGIEKIFVRSIDPDKHEDCWWVEAKYFDLYESGNSYLDEMFDDFS